MNKKTKIIIFEGCDCSGKTTIKDALEKKTSYAYVCVDRLLMTSIVYNVVMNRNLSQQNDLIDKLKNLCKYCKPIFIFVNTHPDVIWERIKKRGDDVLTSKNKVISICNEFNYRFDRLQSVIKDFKVIRIDGAKSIEESVRRILDGIC